MKLISEETHHGVNSRSLEVETSAYHTVDLAVHMNSLDDVLRVSSKLITGLEKIRSISTTGVNASSIEQLNKVGYLEGVGASGYGVNLDMGLADETIKKIRSEMRVILLSKEFTSAIESVVTIPSNIGEDFPYEHPILSYHLALRNALSIRESKEYNDVFTVPISLDIDKDTSIFASPHKLREKLGKSFDSKGRSTWGKYLDVVLPEYDTESSLKDILDYMGSREIISVIQGIFNDILFVHGKLEKMITLLLSGTTHFNNRACFYDTIITTHTLAKTLVDKLGSLDVLGKHISTEKDLILDAIIVIDHK